MTPVQKVHNSSESHTAMPMVQNHSESQIGMPMVQIHSESHTAMHRVQFTQDSVPEGHNPDTRGMSTFKSPTLRLVCLKSSHWWRTPRRTSLWLIILYRLQHWSRSFSNSPRTKSHPRKSPKGCWRGYAVDAADWQSLLYKFYFFTITYATSLLCQTVN